ncbi:polysaccharide deacetylase family protein [Streptomyces sp. NPDC086787]|uniref:polysaccharide deacetylase family protein n=1 Tax=Streptomyces sp. NPDC086787 TaxID=3365759 RepID=UPI00382DE72F
MTRPRRSRWCGALTATVLTAAVLSPLTGCAQSVDPIERLGKKAAQKVRPRHRTAEQTARRWGLKAPLAPAPRPPARSATPAAVHSDGPSPPPVLDRVRTHDRVVFLTYDDAAEHDPRFVDMVRELRLPVSMFLTDGGRTPGDARLAGLRSAGAAVQNLTLDHTPLRGRPFAEQRAQICEQQDRLANRLGHRPRLLRPPDGGYDRTTLRAAADCGVSAVVLWRAATTADDLTYTHGPAQLRPGDIVLIGSDTPTAPTLHERTASLLRRAQSRGLTVGRLEDYL